jgi:hypothetical protein
MTSLLEDRFYLQQCRSSSFIFPLEADSLFAPLDFFRLKEFCFDQSSTKTTHLG